MSILRRLLRGGDCPAWLTDQPIAHRGLHDAQRPENSLAAFEAAAAAGYPIELDVHRTADDKVVVFHDDGLDRLTGASGRVEQTTMAELSGLRLLHTDERVPSLHEVLECVADRVPVVIELKTRGPIGPLESAVLETIARHPGRYSVQSFNPWSMVWWRRRAPSVPRGMLSGDTREYDVTRPEQFVLRVLGLAPLVAPHYVGYELAALPHPAPSGLRGYGVPLLAWTIRTNDDLARARRVADNVIFEGIDPT